MLSRLQHLANQIESTIFSPAALAEQAWAEIKREVSLKLIQRSLCEKSKQMEWSWVAPGPRRSGFFFPRKLLSPLNEDDANRFRLTGLGARRRFLSKQPSTPWTIDRNERDEKRIAENIPFDVANDTFTRVSASWHETRQRKRTRKKKKKKTKLSMLHSNGERKAAKMIFRRMAKASHPRKCLPSRATVANSSMIFLILVQVRLSWRLKSYQVQGTRKWTMSWRVRRLLGTFVTCRSWVLLERLFFSFKASLPIFLSFRSI